MRRSAQCDLFGQKLRVQRIAIEDMADDGSGDSGAFHARRKRNNILRQAGAAKRTARAEVGCGKIQLGIRPDQIEQFGLVAPPADEIAAYADRHTELSPLNTTIAVVATDAALSKAGCRRVAVAAQDGLARTIRPCHTPLDGDTVFALATGAIEVPPDPTTPGSMSPETRLITDVGAAAADCLARAVLVGVLAAESVAGIPSYRDMLPGAFE